MYLEAASPVNNKILGTRVVILYSKRLLPLLMAILVLKLYPYYKLTQDLLANTGLITKTTEWNEPLK